MFFDFPLLDPFLRGASLAVLFWFSDLKNDDFFDHFSDLDWAKHKEYW